MAVASYITIQLNIIAPITIRLTRNRRYIYVELILALDLQLFLLVHSDGSFVRGVQTYGGSPQICSVIIRVFV